MAEIRLLPDLRIVSSSQTADGGLVSPLAGGGAGRDSPRTLRNPVRHF